MDLGAFNLHEIQNFLALAQTAEAEGVTDLRFLREKLFNHLAEQVKDLKPAYAIRTKARKERKALTGTYGLCPECGHSLTPSTHEGLNLLTCRKCRWSKVI